MTDDDELEVCMSCKTTFDPHYPSVLCPTCTAQGDEDYHRAHPDDVEAQDDDAHRSGFLTEAGDEFDVDPIRYEEEETT